MLSWYVVEKWSNQSPRRAITPPDAATQESTWKLTERKKSQVCSAGALGFMLLLSSCKELEDTESFPQPQEGQISPGWKPAPVIRITTVTAPSLLLSCDLAAVTEDPG